jgi:hypothetical protein
MATISVFGPDSRKIPALGDSAVLDLARRYLAAMDRTRRWHSIIRDCYEFCIPNRNPLDGYGPGRGDGREGERKNRRVVDGTAVEALHGFANELQHSLIPHDSPWIKMVPGRATQEEFLDDAAEELEYWTDVAFEDINDSNFSMASHESLLDVGIGTGALRILPGDAQQRLRYEAIPFPDICVEEGPYGSIENVYRPYCLRADLVMRRWPDAVPDEQLRSMLQQPDPKPFVDIVECCVWDTTYLCYRDVVFNVKSGKALWQGASEESQFAVFRWAVAPGEIHGRGVAMNALPFIEALNRAMHLTVSISELAVAGMYMGVGDGVFNPHNVVFKPGAIFPVEDADAGLRAVEQSHDFAISEQLMDTWRQQIKSMMFQEEAAPILNGSQPSATAAILRSERLVQKIGAAFGRLYREMVLPIWKKSVFQLQMQGRLPKELRLNGHEVGVTYIGPLAQSSRMEEIKAVQSSIEMVAGLLGPEIAHAGFVTEEIPRFIGEGFGMPARLIRPASDVAKVVKAAGQMMNGGQPGADPNAQGAPPGGGSPEEMMAAMAGGGGPQPGGAPPAGRPPLSLVR